MFGQTLKAALFLFVVYFGGLGFIKPSYEALTVYLAIKKIGKASEGKTIGEGRDELKALLAKDFPVLAKEDSLLLDVSRAPGNTLSYGVYYEKRIKVMADVHIVSVFDVASDAPFINAFK